MMELIHITDIQVSLGRQRREFKEAEIQELVTSIQDSAFGLMHPIVIRRINGKPTLVAGERRLRAIRQIYDLGGRFSCGPNIVPELHVPCTDIGELNHLDAWEAELEENIRRVDLTWQERAQATAELMKLRTAQAEERDEAPPSVRMISAEVRPDSVPEAAHNAARQELIVSRYLHDPEVKAASSLGEAFKILKKKEEVKKNQELAATVGLTFSSSVHQIYNADTEDLLARGTTTYDIILTDPPYGMGADQFGDSGVGSSAGAHFYDDSPLSWARMMEWFAPLSFSSAKPDAHLYAFCDIEKFPDMKNAFEWGGWKVFRTPLIWHNPDGFRAPWPKQGPQRKYECILFAVKGDKPVTAVKGDVIECRKDSALGHPAQKPVPLLVELLKRSAKPDDIVLDPFAGSGSTIEACHQLKLHCTAIEKDAAAYGIMAKRLAGLAAFDQGLF
jgi:DNA modification methylase